MAVGKRQVQTEMKNILMAAAGRTGMAVSARLSGACRRMECGPFTRNFSISLDAVFW
jgi:hypothetical protein